MSPDDVREAQKRQRDAKFRMLATVSVSVERLPGGLWRASVDDQPHVYEDSAVSAHDAVGLVVARVGTVTIRRGGA